MTSRGEGAEMEAALQRWRAAHPRATLREIEDAVEAELGGARARLVRQLVQESRLSDLEEVVPEERPRCERCGSVVEARGKHRRRLREAGGQAVELERSYAVCPTCGEGVFPPR